MKGTAILSLPCHDMTERKQYEQKLRKARDMLEHRVDERTEDLSRANARLLTEMEQHKNTQNELIQAAKLAVLGQMSAGINHELNQPLTAIRSYADNARSFLEMDKPEPAKDNLSEIGLLTERMAKIIGPAEGIFPENHRAVIADQPAGCQRRGDGDHVRAAGQGKGGYCLAAGCCRCLHAGGYAPAGTGAGQPDQ